MKELELQKLRTLLAELASIRGRHTELITVYVPAGSALTATVAQLRQEQSTASNIKSKSVRKNVLAALEKILAHLRLYRETPPNGLALFCGNVSEKEGVTQLELWAIEPPEPVGVKMYRCDQVFVLGPLQELVREKEVWGLLVLDTAEADVGLLKGKKIEVLKHLDSIVPGKFRAGGQSAARFERVRDALLHDFLKQIGEIASGAFRALPDLKGIIIGGPGPIKERFAEGGFLSVDMQKLLLGVVNTSYTGLPGLEELVTRAEGLIKEAAAMKEKRLLDRLFELLARSSGLAVYGAEAVLAQLAKGTVETVLLSEGFDWFRARLVCVCGYTEERFMRKGITALCPKDNKEMAVLERKDPREEIAQLASQTGAVIETISTANPRGIQLTELGGIGAILRYKV